MAKKRQLAIEERQTIITLKNVGLSYREIAKKVKVSVSTVSVTIKRHSETGENADRKRSGRPKATTKSEDKFLRVSRMRDRRLTGQQLQAQLNSGRSKQVSVSTVKRRLVCRRKDSKDKMVNFALKELAESFNGSRKVGSSETEKGEQKVEVVCSKHPEEPKLFCKDENRAVCSVCDFPHQHKHTVVPVEEAVTEMKDELKSDFKSLQEKKKKYEQRQKTYEEIMEHLKNQVLWTESQIRAEFNKLQQFLKEEEESRLAALREEEEQKRRSVMREMKRIEEQMSSVSDSICAVEEELQKASAPFLISCKDTQSRARAQCSVSEPQLISGALIHVDKHLGNLSFRVWNKMRDKVHFSPVILDPNTANRWLHLSDDLTSVRIGDTYQQVPDNPERNARYANVHGSEGFSSGKHSWDVEVGDHPGWILGLVKESVDRKGKVLASPECGFWCLKHLSGKYTNGVGHTVTVQTSPQRIRVELDYDRGQVSFYNAEDKTHICTYRDTFTEKLYPYFSVGKTTGVKATDIKICPTDFSVYD